MSHERTVVHFVSPSSRDNNESSITVFLNGEDKQLMTRSGTNIREIICEIPSDKDSHNMMIRWKCKEGEYCSEAYPIKKLPNYYLLQYSLELDKKQTSVLSKIATKILGSEEPEEFILMEEEDSLQVFVNSIVMDASRSLSNAWRQMCHLIDSIEEKHLSFVKKLLLDRRDTPTTTWLTCFLLYKLEGLQSVEIIDLLRSHDTRNLSDVIKLSELSDAKELLRAQLVNIMHLTLDKLPSGQKKAEDIITLWFKLISKDETLLQDISQDLEEIVYIHQVFTSKTFLEQVVFCGEFSIELAKHRIIANQSPQGTSCDVVTNSLIDNLEAIVLLGQKYTTNQKLCTVFEQNLEKRSGALSELLELLLKIRIATSTLWMVKPLLSAILKRSQEENWNNNYWNDLTKYVNTLMIYIVEIC
jgi:hypothetical protein